MSEASDLSTVSPMLQWRFEQKTQRMFLTTGSPLCLLVDFTLKKPVSLVCADCFMPLQWLQLAPLSSPVGATPDWRAQCSKCDKKQTWLSADLDTYGDPVTAFSLEEAAERATDWLNRAFPDALFASILAHDLERTLMAAQASLTHSPSSTVGEY